MHLVTNIDTALQALVADWSARPFVWGAADCCHLARDAVQRLHGLVVDLPSYTSERAAARALRRLGGYGAALAAAGLVPGPAAAARRGDLVVVQHGLPGAFREALAVCTGTHAHTTGTEGLVAVPRDQWAAAWGVR